ncbi:MAG: hypothetical protein IKY15_00900, partial [Clostridia bacterium]|nr:hypothetical protein [Clostridia bacterium]
MEKKKKKKLLWFYVVIALIWVLVFAIMGMGDEEAETNKEDVQKEELQKAEFTIQSNDSIGAFGYTVGKTGKYEIVCVKGHGALIINDADLFVLANDEYVGEEYSGLIYEE